MVLLSGGYLDYKPASLPDLAFDRDLAAVSFDDLFYKAEAEAVAVYLGVDDRFRPEKRLEDMPLVAPGYPDTLIFDPYLYRPRAIFRKHP